MQPNEERGNASIKRTPSSSPAVHDGGYRVIIWFFDPHATPKRLPSAQGVCSECRRECQRRIVGEGLRHVLVCGTTGKEIHKYSHSDHDIRRGQALQAPHDEASRRNFKELIVGMLVSQFSLRKGERVCIHNSGQARVDLFLSSAERAHDVNDRLHGNIGSVDAGGKTYVFYQETEVDHRVWEEGTELVYFGPAARGGNVSVKVLGRPNADLAEYEVLFLTDKSTRYVHSKYLAEPPREVRTPTREAVPNAPQIQIKLDRTNMDVAIANTASMKRRAAEAEADMEEAIAKGDLQQACQFAAIMAWWRTHASERMREQDAEEFEMTKRYRGL